MDPLELYLYKLENKHINLDGFISRYDLLSSFKLSDGSNILDIGSFGVNLDTSVGENTTNYLIDIYKNCNIDGMNINSDWKLNPNHTKINMIQSDFFTYNFSKKYDLIVCDMYFDQCKKIIYKDYLINYIPNILNSGGYFLMWCHRNLSMLENHPYLLGNEYLDFILDFWKINNPEVEPEKMKEILNYKFGDLYEVVNCYKEIERDYINWFILKLK